MMDALKTKANTPVCTQLGATLRASIGIEESGLWTPVD